MCQYVISRILVYNYTNILKYLYNYTQAYKHTSIQAYKHTSIEIINELQALIYILNLSKKNKTVYDITQLLHNDEERFYTKGLYKYHIASDFMYTTEILH